MASIRHCAGRTRENKNVFSCLPFINLCAEYHFFWELKGDSLGDLALWTVWEHDLTTIGQHVRVIKTRLRSVLPVSVKEFRSMGGSCVVDRRLLIDGEPVENLEHLHVGRVLAELAFTDFGRGIFCLSRSEDGCSDMRALISTGPHVFPQTAGGP